MLSESTQLCNNTRGHNCNAGSQSTDLLSNMCLLIKGSNHVNANLIPNHTPHSAAGWSICGTKEQILIFDFFSSNFDDFLLPKQPIL